MNKQNTVTYTLIFFYQCELAHNSSHSDATRKEYNPAPEKAYLRNNQKNFRLILGVFGGFCNFAVCILPKER